MKKITLLLSSLLLVFGVNAQKLLISEPSAISKLVTIDVADHVDPQSSWGNVAITQNYIDIEVEVADDGSTKDSMGCQTLINTTMTGKAALVYRGDCAFGLKAKNAQDQGAIMVLIVNNNPLGVVGMNGGTNGLNVNIPVMMIGKADGDLMNASINAGNVVKVSLAPWSFDLAYDMEMQPGGDVVPQYLTQPKVLMDAAATLGTADYYTNFRSAVIGLENYSTMVVDTIVGITQFNSGSSLLFGDTGFFAPNPAMQPTSPLGSATSTTAGDSSTGFILNNMFDISTLPLGAYDITTFASPIENGFISDSNLVDNETTTVYTVTDSTYSRTAVESSGKMHIDQTVTLTNNYEWGNVYTFPLAAGKQIKSVTVPVFIAANSGTDDLVGTTFDVKVYEWVNADADSTIDIGELVNRGLGSYTFPAGSNVDQATRTLEAEVEVVDFNTGKPGIVLKDGATYVVTAAIPGGGDVGWAIDNSSDNPSRLLPWNDPNAYLFQQILIDLSDRATAFSGFINLGPTVQYITLEDAPTSIKDANNKIGINLYPNPSKNNEITTLDVSMNSTQDYIRYTVMDITGKVITSDEVKDVKQASFQLDMSQQAPGSYIIKVETPEGFNTENLMKN